MIKTSDFKNWLEDPITKKYLKYVKDIKLIHQQELVNFINSAEDCPLMLIGNLGGRIYICDALSDMKSQTINDFYGETDDKESDYA